MATRARANGEGSIYPYRNGFAAYVWVTKPAGGRARKYVYGPDRYTVHSKWLKLHQQAQAGPVATRVPTVVKYLAYWLEEIVKPNLAPAIQRRVQLLQCGRGSIVAIARIKMPRWVEALREASAELRRAAEVG